MVKRKVSLGAPVPARKQHQAAAATSSDEVVELFFNSGIMYHEVPLPDGIPDVISSFVITKAEGPGAGNVRVAQPGEEPDVELSAIEHLAEFSGRWLPFPYQLSCLHAVQMFITGGARPRLLLAVDTIEAPGNGGRHLDAQIDANRPYPPLTVSNAGKFLDHADTREFLRRLAKEGVDRAPFKYAALLETLAPVLPRLRFSPISQHTPIEVSMVLDLGNSRSTALLVESRDGQMFSVPLQVRNSSNPLQSASGTIGSRITFYPSPFNTTVHNVAVAASFAEPSIARMGREALDRALETPHRYACSLSGPKRYLWDGEPSGERWHHAHKQSDEYHPIRGRVLKYIADGSGGLALREDGPSAPPDPRYAPRSMMLFAMIELLSQALSQINEPGYRAFQGKEGVPRILRHLVLTYPSAMPTSERAIYERLVHNAVDLVGYLYNIPVHQRPNAREADSRGASSYDPFLLADEALAAQMVYVYEEVVHAYGGNMSEMVSTYGHADGTVRIASVDIGGGTCDVMVAEYKDKLPGTGTALEVRKLFQDGVSVAGDDVCRAICEDIIFEQVLQQLPHTRARSQMLQLFEEGDAGHGAAWRTLRAKLVPYFWMPLARCFWSLAEGRRLEGHVPERQYSVEEIVEMFAVDGWSSQMVNEANAFLSKAITDFPGLNNLFFRFDRAEVDQAIDKVLREPLRRYSDILAQFDIDLLVLAGRTSSLERVYELFVAELPVPAPRIRRMSNYRVSDWYPAKWRRDGFVDDPKSTVAAGATILHLAARNRLPGLLIDEVIDAQQTPIYGLYQSGEPHIARSNELFRDGKTSPEFAYTGGMMIGFRYVDSEEMDGSPLYEVSPTSETVKKALLEDRVSLQFRIEEGVITVDKVRSQKGKYSFEPTDFQLKLRTAVQERYWLDSGVLRGSRRYLENDEQ